MRAVILFLGIAYISTIDPIPDKQSVHEGLAVVLLLALALDIWELVKK